ncbi:apolipoprotein A-V [Sceloporus undulatus]|uniref:apolipoprotein A-V n=1 Tax=Sceloporus undulatus TaxID=8520 RepID=UPI001C4DAB47|nr:apolipoprotein A-V [Sceloporus undulatus]
MGVRLAGGCSQGAKRPLCALTVHYIKGESQHPQDSPKRRQPTPCKESPRIIMSPQTTLLAVFLVTFSVSHSHPLQNSFGDYISQLTHDKDGAEQAQRFKLGQGTTKNLKERLQDGANHMGNILEKLAPLSSGFQPWFYQDADGLQKLIKREMEGLRMKLSPYMDEVGQQISRTLENLRSRLTPVMEELLGQVSLHARELHQQVRFDLSLMSHSLGNVDEIQMFATSYGEKMAFLTDHVKAIFHPYVDRLVSEIRRSVDELHRNVVPQSTATREQLSQYIQEFSEKLTLNVQDLHLNIERSLEHLKGQLSLHSTILAAWHSASGRQRSLGQDAGTYLDAMGQEVQERIEEFRRDTVLQIDNFTRALDREMGEMKLKLSTPPSYLGELQENPIPLEDLHTRLDSLWKDISQGLKELSSSLS